MDIGLQGTIFWSFLCRNNHFVIIYTAIRTRTKLQTKLKQLRR
jgi:hypothetical protein